MRVSDIASVIEHLAPTNLAYEWDNVGLLCGDLEQEVKKVLLCLDLDINVVNEAAESGAQMIISHHPIMFDPISKITEQTPEGRVIRELIRRDISFYAAHTNLDIAKGGLNDLLSQKIGLVDVKILEYTKEDIEGIGRIGRLQKPITLKELADRVKKALNIEILRYSGESDTIISRVAVNTGGGTALIEAAVNAGAEVFITGDYKYSQVRDMVAKGVCVLDVAHFDTEIIVCELLYNYLTEQYGGALEIEVSRTNKNVVKTM